MKNELRERVGPPPLSQSVLSIYICYSSALCVASVLIAVAERVPNSFFYVHINIYI